MRVMRPSGGVACTVRPARYRSSASTWAAPLPLQHAQQLPAGERHRDQRVAEGLRGMELRERDLSVRTPGGDRCTQAAGIGERRLCARLAHRRQVRIGDEAAEIALARLVRLLGELAHDAAHDALALHGGERRNAPYLL